MANPSQASFPSVTDEQHGQGDAAHSIYRTSPFETPIISRPPSFLQAQHHADTNSNRLTFRPFHSRRTEKRTRDTPREKNKKSQRECWLWVNPLIGLVLGILITGALIYLGLQSTVGPRNYCSVLDENFATPHLNPRIWTIEQQVGGFGNEEFDQTTASHENIFIQGGQLHIRPTLQDESLINQHSIINLTETGSCTSNYWMSCVAVTNPKNGTIVPPVRSARINTKIGASIKYGRVEVTAKISRGDWLWPAIWMLPTDNVYGPWPASGEIDIMESRGNNYSYPSGGNNIASSTLHYGPDASNDAFWTTTNSKAALHSEYGQEFHVYGLEWTNSYIYTYIDSRLNQVLYLPFDQFFWNKGDFPTANANGTLLVDPWSQTGRMSTPFDQSFYLIINVAVGGENGWFPDGIGGKPWVDGSATAEKDFWNARDQWYPTWNDNSEMIIDRVQMWQQC